MKSRTATFNIRALTAPIPLVTEVLATKATFVLLSASVDKERETLTLATTDREAVTDITVKTILRN